RAEGDGDQQDEDEGLPGQPRPLRRRCGAVAHGGRVVGDAFLGGELLEAGSTDEGLVEDDGPVLVLATPGGALGGPLGWVRRTCISFMAGLGENGSTTGRAATCDTAEPWRTPVVRGCAGSPGRPAGSSRRRPRGRRRRRPAPGRSRWAPARAPHGGRRRPGSR